MTLHSPSLSVCTGRIAAIDLPNRMIALRLPTGVLFDMIVAPNCRVFLNEEPVRLRLLLVGDEVEASLAYLDGLPSALNIRAQTRHRLVDAPGLTDVKSASEA